MSTNTNCDEYFNNPLYLYFYYNNDNNDLKPLNFTHYYEIKILVDLL